MLPQKSLRRADVVASSAMIAIGLAVIYAASRMPWSSTLTGGAAQWYLSPGLFPTVVGALLILFSARVLLIAVKEGGHRGVVSATVQWFRSLPRNRPIHRVLVIFLLMVAYVGFGIGQVNYLVASAAFLFVSIAIFWWPDARNRLYRRMAMTLGVSILLPFALSYVFSNLLGVPMP